MSVPFSNTHLRVPQGFGTLLEGLAREVLRDQPEDIPKYAAQYFDTLLKQREESGMDPAEWAAKLEDRFYNNRAFKTTRPAPEKDTTADVTSSKKKSYESQTEDELSHSAEASNVSTTQLNNSEEVNLTESTEEEEEEKHIMSLERRLSEGETINRFPGADVQSDDLSGTEEERDATISKLDQVDRESNENESNTLEDQDIPHSELESTDVLSFSGVTNVDVCAKELGMAEDAEDHKQDAAVEDKDILHSVEEETTKVEEPVEVFPYSGLAGVDVCATELGGAERKMDGATAKIHEHTVEEESLKLQPEEALVQSSLSQCEREDQAEITKPEEGTENEAFSEEIHEGLAHIEGSLYSIDVTKEDSLVEISFEDEVTAVATGQIISGTQDDEHEMKGTEMKVYSEREEMESHHEGFEITKGKVDRNESYLNHSDDEEEGEGVINISSSHQPTTESDEEDSENETDHKNEDKKKISEGEFHQDQNQDFEKEANFNNSDIGEDKEDIHTEGYSEMEGEEINDGDAENISSQVIQSSISAVPIKTESETFVGSAQHLPEENDKSQRKLAESQSEDTMEEKEVTSKGEEELLGEGTADPEIQEESDAMLEEESISLTRGADGTVADHQEEQRPHECEKNNTEPEGKSNDKQEECSRPQEEEDIMDIPLDDPEANRAAAKIQAGFRGHMTRKKMKPEDKAEGEEVSSTGDVLNGSQGDPETGGSGAVERDDTSVPEQ